MFHSVRLIPFDVKKVEDKQQPSIGVQMIRAQDIWEKSKKGRGVVIAVLDTGCQKDHPALKDRIIDGRNFTKDNNRNPYDYSDNNGHGTHVAGIIAAQDMGGGVIGVAPEAKLLILKVLSKDGSGSEWDMIRAMQYAISWRGHNGERVRIISLSLGSPVDNPRLHQAVIQAVNRDILVVCAAGNMGDGNAQTEEKHYPGAYPEVVQVGAVDSQMRIAFFSNTNHEIDLVAPGVDIRSTYPDSKYAVLSGTSMAAPHVAGAAALIINQCEAEFRRALSEAEIYAQICKRTVPLGYEKWEEGNGLLNLAVRP